MPYMSRENDFAESPNKWVNYLVSACPPNRQHILDDFSVYLNTLFLFQHSLIYAVVCKQLVGRLMPDFVSISAKYP